MNRGAWLELDDDALLEQCELDRFRASGPGGQKRNKTESAVRLRHLPSGLAARAVESRSQHKNRVKALERLRVALAIELRESSETLDAEAMAALGRWVAGPRRVELERFAVLLDMLSDADMSLRDVADRLEVNSSAVARVLRDYDPARRWVNQERARLGLGPLR